jgi:hypothetical protein
VKLWKNFHLEAAEEGQGQMQGQDDEDIKGFKDFDGQDEERRLRRSNATR